MKPTKRAMKYATKLTLKDTEFPTHNMIPFNPEITGSTSGLCSGQRLISQVRLTNSIHKCPSVECQQLAEASAMSFYCTDAHTMSDFGVLETQ